MLLFIIFLLVIVAMWVLPKLLGKISINFYCWKESGKKLPENLRVSRSWLSVIVFNLSFFFIGIEKGFSDALIGVQIFFLLISVLIVFVCKAAGTAFKFQ